MQYHNKAHLLNIPSWNVKVYFVLIAYALDKTLVGAHGLLFTSLTDWLSTCSWTLFESRKVQSSIQLFRTASQSKPFVPAPAKCSSVIRHYR